MCEVHGVTLQVEMTPISYGLMTIESPQEQQVRQNQFPHAGHAFGGCIVAPNSPRSAIIKFCPQCRLAEEQWMTARNFRPY